MPTEILGMYGAISGAADAIASMDIPDDGVITGIDWDVSADLDADAEDVAIELSFIATRQLTQSDVRGRISSVGAQISLTTSGAPAVGLQKFVGPMELNVAGGERVYLHSGSASGVAGFARCNIHLDTSRPARRSARRR